MPHCVFISYSRRESPFVDVLLGALEEDGLDVWVDYHSLVPAQPWLDQIMEGIRRADVFLLVVSKGSMSSASVKIEYEYALAQKKRILLLLFEATALPDVLQKCEWIDFRTSFHKKKNELLVQLDRPVQREGLPQSGFKAPSIVWISFLMSLLVLVVSIPAWWTFFVPLVLVPLPVHILRRDLPFYRVRFILLVLPVALFFSWMFFLSYPVLYAPFSIAILISLVLAPLLLALLSSRGMRLWGKPVASAPRFANPYQPKKTQPNPVPFFIEHAPQDKKYAQAIGDELIRYGHPQVNSVEQAQANFVLLSHYKNASEIDPGKHVLYPVLVQDVHIEDRALQRIQWIDFRRGIRNLDRLALLLHEPEKLLKALGVTPMSGQVMYPRIIEILDYFLILLAFFSISIWIPLGLELGRQLSQLENWTSFVIANVILSLLTFGILFLVRRDLIRREGRLASFKRLAASLFWIGFIISIQAFYLLVNVDRAIDLAGALSTAEDLRGSVISFLPCGCTLGMVLIGFLSIWNWRDLMRWFPER